MVIRHARSSRSRMSASTSRMFASTGAAANACRAISGVTTPHIACSRRANCTAVVVPAANSCSSTVSASGWPRAAATSTGALVPCSSVPSMSKMWAFTVAAAARRARRHRSGTGSCAGQVLAQLQHRGEAVAVLGDALQYLGGREGEVVRIARAQDILHLVPRDGRRGGRPLAGPQGVDGDGRLVLVVLAPVDEHPARAQALAHVGDDEVGMAALQYLREALGERLRLAVRRG